MWRGNACGFSLGTLERCLLHPRIEAAEEGAAWSPPGGWQVLECVCPLALGSLQRWHKLQELCPGSYHQAPICPQSPSAPDFSETLLVPLDARLTS